MAVTHQVKWMGKREELVLLNICYYEGHVAVKGVCFMRKKPSTKARMNMCAWG